MIIAFSLSCSGNILCGVGKDNQSRQVMPPGPVIALSLWPLAIVYSEFQLSRILLFPTRSSHSYSKNKLMKQTYLSTLLCYFVNCCCFCGFGLPVACRPAMRSAVCVWALIAVMFANLRWLIIIIYIRSIWLSTLLPKSLDVSCWPTPALCMTLKN